MKKLLFGLLLCVAARLAAVSVNDVKVSQATTTVPTYTDRFITPAAVGVWGFDASNHPVFYGLGANVSIINGKLEVSSTIGTAWGNISGNIALQTDLQTALGLKANTSSLGTAAFQPTGAFDPAGAAAAITLAGLGGVPTSRTINTHALNANLVLTAADLSLATVATSGAYADLTGKPSLFSGAYADLTGKPTLFSGAYADLTGKPTLGTAAAHDIGYFELALGNPSVTGYVLSSTTLGVRSWIPMTVGGTVTSVGLSLPTGFTVTVSPITTSGTLTATFGVTGILKGAAGAFVAASAGTDYVVPHTTLAGYGITDAVPNTRTVAGYPLSSDVGLTYTDVGAAPAAGNSSIVNLGVIVSGVWHGTSIDTAYTDAKVTSVATRTGAVSLTAADIGAGTFPSGGYTMQGNLLFSADATYNIGAASATRPNIVYAATSFIVGGTVNNAHLIIDGAAGSTRHLIYRTAGVNRWHLHATNAAESGGDAGSNLEMEAYTDAGVLIDNPLKIDRVAGGTITFSSARPISFGTVSAGTWHGTAITDTYIASATTWNGKATAGAVGSSGLTMNTARLLGRSTAAVGAIEEITLGTNLTFSGTTLNAAGGSTSFANPSANVSNTVVNGSASTAMRSDAAPAISTSAALQFATLGLGTAITGTHVMDIQAVNKVAAGFGDLVGSGALFYFNVPTGFVDLFSRNNHPIKVSGFSGSEVEWARFTAAGNLLIGGTAETGLTGAGGMFLYGTTDATSGAAGTLICSGGIYVSKKIWTSSSINTALTTDATTTATGSIITAGGMGVAKTIWANAIHLPSSGFAMRDTSAAYDLTIASTSSTAFTAGRTLTLDMVNADRTLKIQGNPTLDDWFNQSVKTTATPQFARIGLGAAADATILATIAGKSQIVYSGTTIATNPAEGGQSMLTISSNPTGSDGSQSALLLQRNTSSTNVLVSGAILQANSTGTAAAGFGTRFRFDIKGSDGTIRTMGGVGVILENTTDTGSLVFQSTNAGTPAIALQLYGDLHAVFSSSITTGAPTGGTAAAWKLGSVVSGIAATMVTTNYVQVDIGGVLVKLATVTSVP